jgi:colicin import membrane protein
MIRELRQYLTKGSQPMSDGASRVARAKEALAEAEDQLQALHETSAVRMGELDVQQRQADLARAEREEAEQARDAARAQFDEVVARYNGLVTRLRHVRASTLAALSDVARLEQDILDAQNAWLQTERACGNSSMGVQWAATDEMRRETHEAVEGAWAKGKAPR